MNAVHCCSVLVNICRVSFAKNYALRLHISKRVHDRHDTMRCHATVTTPSKKISSVGVPHCDLVSHTCKRSALLRTYTALSPQECQELPEHGAWTQMLWEIINDRGARTFPSYDVDVAHRRGPPRPYCGGLFWSSSDLSVPWPERNLLWSLWWMRNI